MLDKAELNSEMQISSVRTKLMPLRYKTSLVLEKIKQSIDIRRDRDDT